MPNAVPEIYLRRLDGERVRALRYTGDNLDQLRAWLGGSWVATPWPGRVILARDQPPGHFEVRAWDWVLDDGGRVYPLRAYEFWSHCRSILVE